MRLLKLLPDDTFELASFSNDTPPPYAILSHTWTEGQEVTYQELKDGTGEAKTGFDKIRFCGKQAAADGLQYFWVDTCCIDKTSSVELGTAINYMFRWYQRSSKCYVYLSDVSAPIPDAAAFPITWMETFRRSRWFTRGWTLQELIAPASVDFFSKEHKLLGNRRTLEHEVCKITGIPMGALRGQSLDAFSVEERMSWISARETTVKEDRYYCLLGIFDVFLPFILGEGENNAKMRLEEEIEKRQRREGMNQRSLDVAHLEKGRPACVVPFPRDPDFVDRGTLLKELQERLSVPMSRVALVGIGGVGKSQLSLEYCYRTREALSETHVLWAHASNAARFEESFRDIADRVKIEGRQDPQANVFKLVHDWLCDTKEPWLLVLDNVDDAGFLLDAQAIKSTTSAKPLLEYLPHCDHGSILVTSRNREAALQLVENGCIIALNSMSAPQALNLLTRKLGEQAASASNAELTELAAVLEYMPLALSQAAAYISQRTPFVSVEKYLDQFRSERKRTRLLGFDKGQQRRDREATNSIITTWYISFEHIQQKWPSAADLLSLMSFFDRQGIPKHVLLTQRKHEEKQAIRKIDEARSSLAEKKNQNGLECNDGGVKELEIDSANESQNEAFHCEESKDNLEDDLEDTFVEDVTVLRNFAFISVSPDATIFEMHALMQFSMRTWLAEKGTLELYKGQFINKLCAAFPLGTYENWALCQPLFAHAKAAVSHEPEAASTSVQWAKLLGHAAWYSLNKGNYDEAVTLATLSTKAYEAVLGPEHENTVWSKDILASAYAFAGNWGVAEELQIQIMENRMAGLGVKHLYTLASMRYLAETYSYQGRWDEAEKLQIQVMEGRKAKLGMTHRDTASITRDLAVTFQNQGRWEEAEKLLTQVLETYKTELEIHHPWTLTCMGDLATTYSNQGRWVEAEKLELQVLEAYKIKLGVDHPDTLASIGNLALTYLRQGRWKEAAELELQVLETSKTKLGVDHPDTLTSMGNLATTYSYQGRWEEAAELELQVLESYKTKLGIDHPDTLRSMGNLAVTYSNQGRWEESEELGLQVLESYKTKLGVDHPSTLISMYSLAYTRKSLGRDAEAIALMHQCVQGQQKVLRVDHPDLLDSLETLKRWKAEQADAELISQFEAMRLA